MLGSLSVLIAVPSSVRLPDLGEHARQCLQIARDPFDGVEGVDPFNGPKLPTFHQGPSRAGADLDAAVRRVHAAQRAPVVIGTPAKQLRVGAGER
jgi:hypothetical protein